jgi:hypothetical protein
MKLLNDVRISCKVFIDYEESLQCIRLHSLKLQNVEKGIVGVKAKIKHARADAAGLAPIYIVEPPSATAMKQVVSPKFKETEKVDLSPVVERVVMSGSNLSVQEHALWSRERDTILESNAYTFSSHLKKALKEFRALKSGMRMRIQFGHFQLLLYRKDFKDSSYCFQKFSKMMSENRTKAQLEKMYCFHLLPIVITAVNR